jgi:hypothetical protein
MDSTNSPSLSRILFEDAFGQLWRKEGQMAALGSEDGVLKLDWVDGVERLLANPALLAMVEMEARDLWEQGIRHIIWAGMGGSIIALRVLVNLGLCDGSEAQHFTIYPLDSTDPAALNAIIRKIAGAKKLSLSSQDDAHKTNSDFLRELLDDVMMVGVSMGMTSEEPITHLEWFTDLLQQASLSPAEHLLVMTLPGSYLDNFARDYGVATRPLQPDGGNGTGGRMSAPTTRVFLLPAALYLTRASSETGLLRQTLQRAWRTYHAPLATQQPRQPAQSPFVQLAAALSDASINGSCRMLLHMPGKWSALIPWIEQLMEESLGKGGKGIVVFDLQTLNPSSPAYSEQGTINVCVRANPMPEMQNQLFTLDLPYLTDAPSSEALSAAAASFLGWQFVMALYGYLQDIHFAGQPAVENYKARARVLRGSANPLSVLEHWQDRVISLAGRFTLFVPQSNPWIATATTDTSDTSDTSGTIDTSDTSDTIASVFAQTLRQAESLSDTMDTLSYLDVTINGEVHHALWSLIDTRLRYIGNELLGVPVKLRSAPASYHSTEQSEMDGPPNLISLRLLARQHASSLVGAYSATFLAAQAVSTWQAMLEQQRSCFLLVYDGAFDEGALPAFQSFLADVEQYLRA